MVLVAPAMKFQVVPPSVETCHCTVAAGELEALAVKLAMVFSQTVVFAGLPVMVGGVLTVSVAAVELVLPHASVKTARY